MFDDLDEALRKLLIRELPIKNGEVDVAFDLPKREWSARLSRPTIDFFLYEVRENQKLRQAQPAWETERLSDGTTIQRRKPVRLDLNYLITVWATEPEDEHRLLSRVLIALFRYPNVPEELLPESLQSQGRQVPFMVAQPTELTNPMDMWNVLDNEIRPGIILTVTLAVDPYMPVRVPLVRERELVIGPSSHPERLKLEETAASDQFWSIGGCLRSQKPLEFEHVRMTLVERGIVVPVQPNGQFVIGRLRAGAYTLEVTAPERQARRFSITIPAADYDLEI